VTRTRHDFASGASKTIVANASTSGGGRIAVAVAVQEFFAVLARESSRAKAFAISAHATIGAVLWAQACLASVTNEARVTLASAMIALAMVRTVLGARN